jgi:hypothetical protein
VLQYRILANDGAGWNWEVASQDREMIARGIAVVTHAQYPQLFSLPFHCPAPSMKRSGAVLAGACPYGDGLVTLIECRIHKQPRGVTWIDEFIGRRLRLGVRL